MLQSIGSQRVANAGDIRDVGSIPGLGRSPGGGKGNPLQYPCLENPMDRGAWQATVHGVAEADTHAQLHVLMTTGKTISLTGWTFVSKVMSLLFNMLSRFVVAFLPRSKHLLLFT